MSLGRLSTARVAKDGLDQEQAIELRQVAVLWTDRRGHFQRHLASAEDHR